MNQMNRVAIGVAIALALGASAAQAAYAPMLTTTGNNLTVLGSTNGLTGGTNDVTFTWDRTFRTSVVTDGGYNATFSSPTKLSGFLWTAHDVNIYAPGSYTFYTCYPTSSTTCGTGPAYNMTVGTGQVGVHMLVDWVTSTNIDVVILWDMNKSWAQTGTASPFSTNTPNPNGNTMNTVWDGASIDTNLDADNYSGTKLVDGPFLGQSVNFNVNGIHAVPIPATAWLLGSGLLGLIGLAGRRKVA